MIGSEGNGKVAFMSCFVDSKNTRLNLPALTPSFVFGRAFQPPRDFNSFLSIHTRISRAIREYGTSMPC